MALAPNGGGIRFAGFAHALPSRLVNNDEVLAALETQSAPYLSASDLRQLLNRTKVGFRFAGTETRFHRAPDEQASSLCVAAGQAALADASLQPEDIDLLIYVGVGRGFLEPATANTFQDLLGLTQATCFDLLDACASWLRALHIGRTMIMAGIYRTVMILNGEFAGRAAYRYDLRSLDEFEHWFPGVTIGEASTATIIQADAEDDNFTASFRNRGSDRGLCLIPMPNYAEYLAQPPVRADVIKPMQFLSFGSLLLDKGADMLIEHYHQDGPEGASQWDHIFGHAASNHMCMRIGKACELDFERFHFAHQRFGNTVSASVPLSMSVAKQEGKFKDGGRVLILVASAGLSTGVVSFTYRS